jgi:branched-chain amino acid transport system ATP-binding protein
VCAGAFRGPVPPPQGEALANLKTEGISVLIAESNEVHVADLLSHAFRIERGSVSLA